jgi:hypothetical protein
MRHSIHVGAGAAGPAAPAIHTAAPASAAAPDLAGEEALGSAGLPAAKDAPFALDAAADGFAACLPFGFAALLGADAAAASSSSCSRQQAVTDVPGLNVRWGLG